MDALQKQRQKNYNRIQPMLQASESKNVFGSKFSHTKKYKRKHLHYVFSLEKQFIAKQTLFIINLAAV